MSISDPTRQIISTSPKRDKRCSPPEQGKKENIYTHSMLMKMFSYMSYSSNAYLGEQIFFAVKDESFRDNVGNR